MESYVEHVQRLLEGPAQTVGYLGTRDEHMQVSVIIVFSFVVKANPFRVIAYMPEAVLRNTRRNLQISDYVTLLVVNAGTFEGVQVKGHAILREGDAEGEAFLKMNFRRMKEFYGTEFPSIKTTPLAALELTVEEIYNQTPGAGAGERLHMEKGKAEQ